MVVSGVSGAPTLYIMGSRGAADSNAGTLTKLIDATKNWGTNYHANQIVMIVGGTGLTEAQPWRNVVSNDATSLTVDSPWLIQHDTTTEYVVLTDSVSEVTGHGLTAPVTDVQVSEMNGMVLFAQGDAVAIRRMREYNNAGTWTREFADDGTNKCTFLDYKANANKLVFVSFLGSIQFADPVAWSTASHTLSTLVAVGSQNRKATGSIVYQDQDGEEVVWVFKTDIPWIVPKDGTGTDTPYPVHLPEMGTVRDFGNGRASCTNGVYLYFSLKRGVQRYYSGQFDSVGPDLGEAQSMPSTRKGAVSAMVSLPSKYHVAIDGGTGYSSILDSDGWHERYRAPKGLRIKSLAYQPIPGTMPGRMWMYQGNDVLYIPFPSEGPNELESPAYRFTHEFAITGSWMHAGILDVQKMVKSIKISSDDLVAGAQWFELDYRLDTVSDWVTFATPINTYPNQTLDLTSIYGLASKQIQLRLRGYTTSNTKTPVLLATIVYAVLRTDVKYTYPMTFRIMDHEPLLSLREEDTMTGADKLAQVEDWADSSTDSMLMMTSVSPLYHNRLIFLNPPNTWQILHAGQDGNEFRKDVYICTATAQEA